MVEFFKDPHYYNTIEYVLGEPENPKYTYGRWFVSREPSYIRLISSFNSDIEHISGDSRRAEFIAFTFMIGTITNCACLIFREKRHD